MTQLGFYKRTMCRKARIRREIAVLHQICRSDDTRGKFLLCIRPFFFHFLGSSCHAQDYLPSASKWKWEAARKDQNPRITAVRLLFHLPVRDTTPQAAPERDQARMSYPPRPRMS